MPTKLTTEERLTTYGLSPGKRSFPELRVPKGRTLNLQAHVMRKKVRVFPLKPKSIDEVKSWIGFVDSGLPSGFGQDFDRWPSLKYPPSNSGSGLPEGDDYRAGLKNVAKAYVHGDSKVLQSWKNVLDVIVTKLPPIVLVPFDDIVVEAGSTLKIGAGVDVLFGNRVIIKTGGKIVVDGNIKIDCFSIRGHVA